MFTLIGTRKTCTSTDQSCVDMEITECARGRNKCVQKLSSCRYQKQTSDSRVIDILCFSLLSCDSQRCYDEQFQKKYFGCRGRRSESSPFRKIEIIFSLYQLTNSATLRDKI